MNNVQRISLVAAVFNASNLTLQKSASATPAQQEVLARGWPSENETGITKLAALSRMLAVGVMVETAEAELAAAGV